jgi:hypothetical protein
MNDQHSKPKDERWPCLCQDGTTREKPRKAPTETPEAYSYATGKRGHSAEVFL